MNKNIFKLFGLACVSLAFVACSDDDYVVGEDSVGAFFPTGVETKAVNLEPGDSERTFTICRSTSVGSFTVNLEVNDPAGLFKVPSEVTFKEGETETTFPIQFDYNSLDLVDYQVEVTIPASQAFTYGTPQLTFTLGVLDDLRWVTLDGEAEYTDGFLSSLFGLDPETWNVQIQKKVGSKGLYRLVDPYGENCPLYDPEEYDPSQAYYLEINANDPDGVYIPLCEIGLDWGYGPMAVWSAAGRYLANGNSLSAIKKAGYCGTLKNGVITFPNKGLFIQMGGSLYYGNGNDAFKVVLPASENK